MLFFRVSFRLLLSSCRAAVGEGPQPRVGGLSDDLRGRRFSGPCSSYPDCPAHIAPRQAYADSDDRLVAGQAFARFPVVLVCLPT